MRNKLRRARGVQPNRSASQLNRFREQTNRTQLIGDENESFACAMYTNTNGCSKYTYYNTTICAHKKALGTHGQ